MIRGGVRPGAVAGPPQRAGDVYLLAAVRREHRRLTELAQRVDRRTTPASVVRHIEAAMIELDDAVQQLAARLDHPAGGPR